MRRWRGYDGCRVMYHKRWDTVGEVSRSVATPPVIGKTDLQSGGRTGLPGRHLREQTANSEFANSVRWFLLESVCREHEPVGAVPIATLGGVVSSAREGDNQS